MREMAAPEVSLELNPGPENPRNSEGAIAELADGRLLLAYTRFYAGCADYAPAEIACRFSPDFGATWDDEDRIIVANEGESNVMSVSLLRLAGGGLGLFYLVKNSWGDCMLYLRKSFDEGRTWGERTCCVPDPGYYVVNNDRVIQLSTGRLIVPAAWHHCVDGTRETHSSQAKAMAFFSDDEGETWRRSESVLEVAIPDDVAGFQEPGVVELRDHSVLMWMRTDLGSQYMSHSHDGGVTWSEPCPSKLMSPLSPASIKRITSTGDLLCVYNDHSGKFPYNASEDRTPLVTAISSDEGRTWRNHRPLETDLDGCYCYTSMTFVGDQVLLSYCAGDSRVGGLNRLRVRGFNVDWLY